MNGKKAKAMRRLAETITARKGLPAVAHRDMPVGFNKTQRVVAADSTRGQYRALKAVVKAAYGRAAA